MEHEQPPPAAPRRRGRRTTALIAAALVLGALAGTVTGYAIQYGRTPTPLPPLAQQKLDTPKAQPPNDATTVKSVNANRWHKTDGDLAAFLIDAPPGAKVEADGYDTLDSFAMGFEGPERVFRDLIFVGFRRAASRSWAQGDVRVEVHLAQYSDYKGADSFGHWRPGPSDGDGAAVPGIPAAAGRLWVRSTSPVSQAYAVARRGDIVMYVLYHDDRGREIAQGDFAQMVKRQWERL
ncbi:hypothetical protein ACGFY6_26865 [Streptomyces sp. NPDC048387]|uniref:hypothetical protein n=1 Tax=Streptomyces sp. NPDC048387 TaxID=3365542 RepID=UPI003713B7D1